MRDNHAPRPSVLPSPLTAFFWSGDALRGRRLGQAVLSAKVDIPEAPARLRADWAREISTRMTLEPGDVEVMPLARARTRWPEYPDCVRAMSAWLSTHGLDGLLADADVALMACRGARYHHDGEQYGGAAFCNLFVSEGKGQEVHFPALDLRIPIVRGTALVFDPSQPHAVIASGNHGFDAADFPVEPDTTQLFLTWELPIDHPAVARALGVSFDPDQPVPATVEDEQIWRDGAKADVCPNTGAWQRARRAG